MSEPPSDQAPDAHIGRLLDDRYRVRRLLGRGGMGAVYEGDHVGLERRVAIKFLLGDRTDADALARFRREAKIASKIDHVNVVDIYDVGTDDSGTDFLVMEYVEGRDLRRALADDGPFSPARAIAIGKQLLSGLHAIHEAGIVHRDIKPANVLLLDGDVVKIMDFGISKATDDGPAITNAGLVVGTPQYMSPEQLAGRDIDRRSDIYAAGLVLYELVAGSPPFVGSNTAQLTAQHLADPPPALERVVPGVPASYVAAVERALEKLPAARFATAVELAAALDDDTRTPMRDDADRRRASAVAGRSEAATKRSKPRAMVPDSKSAPTVPMVAADAVSPRSRHRRPIVIAIVLAVSVPLVVALVMRARQDAPVVVATAKHDAASAPDAAADQHIAYATDAERTGKLALAIVGYEAAYDANRQPELLFRIATLHERLDEPREAVVAYRRYLDAAPTAVDAEHVRTRIAALVTPTPRSPTDAGLPIDAGRPRRPATRPPSAKQPETGQYCRCASGGDPLCRNLEPVRCRCEVGGSPLCETKPAMGLCRVAFSGDASAAGGPCEGYQASNTPLLPGIYNCVHCVETRAFRGESGAPCMGFDQRTAEPVNGTLVSCRDQP